MCQFVVRLLSIGKISTASPRHSDHTATTKIYTLSLHDALPICAARPRAGAAAAGRAAAGPGGLHALRHPRLPARPDAEDPRRSEEHTSELQSPDHLVCRLLLEKKKSKSLYSVVYDD